MRKRERGTESEEKGERKGGNISGSLVGFCTNVKWVHCYQQKINHLC